MKEGWKYCKLGEVCEILDSRRKPITKSKRINGIIPYYGATGLLDYVNDYLFDEKLVLLGEDGAKWHAGEQSAYIITGKAWVNNHAHTLRPIRKKVIDEFLVFYLNYTDLCDYITGVTVPKLNQEKMRSIRIPIPPLSEQQAIVSRLDTQFAKIDALKANAEQQLTEAKALFQKALEEYLRPKEGWKSRMILDCLIKNKKNKQVKAKDYLSNGKYPIVSQESELINGYLNDSSFLFHHDKPVVVFGDHTKVFKFIDFDFIIGADGTQILCPIGEIDCKYFYYSLCNTKIRNLGYARHFKLLKQSNIYMPKSIELQQSIAAKLDAISDRVHQLEENYKTIATYCDDLKQAILKETFQ